MTLLDLIGQSAQGFVTPVTNRPKAKRRRFRRPSKAERLAAEQRLGDELRAKRAAFAESLKPPFQDELLGPWLPDGVEAVKHQEAER